MPDDGRARRHPRRTGPPLTAARGPLLLGLDLGTSAIKAVLMDRDGGECGWAAVATPFHGGEMTVDTLLGALAQLTAALGEARARVVAVGIAGMAECGAPLDRRGRPQAPIIAWHDPRGAEVVERFRRAFGPDLDRSIGQRLRTVSSVAKLGWLVDQGVGPVARWLGVPELSLQALTGREATEFSLAARTGAYHVGERRFLPEVVSALGVAPDVFPPVEPAGLPMGRVSPAGAAWSGLPEGIPVTIAGHDHLVGRSGSGAGPEDLANSVGTAETVVAAVAEPPNSDRALSLRVAVTLMPGGKGWALLASAARSGMVLSAVARALGRTAPEMDDESGAPGRSTAGGELADGDGTGGDGTGGVLAGGELTGGDGIIDAVTLGGPVRLPAAPPGAIWNGVLAALVARAWDAVDRIGQVGGDRIGPVGGDPIGPVCGQESAGGPGAVGGQSSSGGPGPAGGPGAGGGQGPAAGQGLLSRQEPTFGEGPARGGGSVGGQGAARGQWSAGGQGLAAGTVGNGGGLVVFGGGSRSRPWLAAKAAARPGTPVWRSGATEAVARGAALSAGVAAGWWALPDAGPQVLRERVATE